LISEIQQLQFVLFVAFRQYRDDVGNTIEENSSVFKCTGSSMQGQ